MSAILLFIISFTYLPKTVCFLSRYAQERNVMKLEGTKTQQLAYYLTDTQQQPVNLKNRECMQQLSERRQTPLPLCLLSRSQTSFNSSVLWVSSWISGVLTSRFYTSLTSLNSTPRMVTCTKSKINLSICLLGQAAFRSSRRTGRHASCLKSTFLVHDWELESSKYSYRTQRSLPV